MVLVSFTLASIRTNSSETDGVKTFWKEEESGLQTLLNSRRENVTQVSTKSLKNNARSVVQFLYLAYNISLIFSLRVETDPDL